MFAFLYLVQLTVELMLNIFIEMPDSFSCISATLSNLVDISNMITRPVRNIMCQIQKFDVYLLYARIHSQLFPDNLKDINELR